LLQKLIVLHTAKYLLSDVLHRVKEFAISVLFPVMCGDELVEQVFSMLDEKSKEEEEL
jgi:hypothetical protein